MPQYSLEETIAIQQSIVQQDSAAIAQMLANDTELASMDQEAMSSLIYKVAVNASKEDWHDFVVNGDLPAVRLSDAEMDVAKGGVWVAAAVVAVAAIYMMTR